MPDTTYEMIIKTKNKRIAKKIETLKEFKELIIKYQYEEIKGVELRRKK